LSFLGLGCGFLSGILCMAVQQHNVLHVDNQTTS
jgi:hypothetical protein